jgi:hypothetical protein
MEYLIETQHPRIIEFTQNLRVGFEVKLTFTGMDDRVSEAPAYLPKIPRSARVLDSAHIPANLAPITLGGWVNSANLTTDDRECELLSGQALGRSGGAES